MSTLTDIRGRVIDSVKDDAGKLANPSDFDRHIQAAIKKYSKHRPDMKVVDITGNGGHDYDLPTGWSDGFSTARSIEYPVGNVPATLLGNDDFEGYLTPTGKKIRLLDNSPAATESFRVTFTILRTDATIPEVDIDALSWLAASMGCEELARAYTQATDSTINADSVDYKSKAAEFSSRGKTLLKWYKEHLGIKDDDVTTPASAVTDMEMNYPGGSGRLTHPRWARERR